MAVQLNSQKRCRARYHWGGAAMQTQGSVQDREGKKKQPSLFKQQELRVVCNLTSCSA